MWKSGHLSYFWIWNPGLQAPFVKKAILFSWVELAPLSKIVCIGWHHQHCNIINYWKPFPRKSKNSVCRYRLEKDPTNTKWKRNFYARSTGPLPSPLLGLTLHGMCTGTALGSHPTGTQTINSLTVVRLAPRVWIPGRQGRPFQGSEQWWLNTVRKLGQRLCFQHWV